jgi:hypothetical protein
MTIREGAFWPLVAIDLAVGLIGSLLAISWGKVAGRNMDRDTVLFLCKMFGGISLVFLLVIILNR